LTIGWFVRYKHIDDILPGVPLSSPLIAGKVRLATDEPVASQP